MLLEMRLSPGEALLQAPALPLTPSAPRKYIIFLGPQFSHLYNDRIGLEGSKDIFQLKDPPSFIQSAAFTEDLVCTSIVLHPRDTA